MCTINKVDLTFSDVVHRSRSVRVGDDVLLQCELRSNLATPLWTLNGTEVHGYDLSSGFRIGTDGLLLIEAQQDQTGLYTCHAVENNIKVAVVTFNVTFNMDPPTPPLVATTRSILKMLPAPTEGPSSENSTSEGPRPPLLLLSPRNMEAIYLSLVTVLSALCVVLAVVLVYVGFCLRVGQRGKYSLRAAAAVHPSSKRSRKQHRSSAHMELKAVSSHCNGFCNGVSKRQNARTQDEGFLHIVPGEGHASPNKDALPPAPPLPPAHCDFPNGLSATLPSVLRRMNGNSYVLLRQSESENTSPLCYPFAEELNKMLEKRKHTLLLPRPDESSV